MLETNPAAEISTAAPPVAPESPEPAAPSEPGQSVESPSAALARENSELREKLKLAEATNRALVASKVEDDEHEKIVKHKMARGLTRPQAVAVIRRQREEHQRQPHRAPAPSLALYEKLHPIRG